MSYVDEVIAQVVEKNPVQPEFHQAVKEVLEKNNVAQEEISFYIFFCCELGIQMKTIKFDKMF